MHPYIFAIDFSTFDLNLKTKFQQKKEKKINASNANHFECVMQTSCLNVIIVIPRMRISRERKQKNEKKEIKEKLSRRTAKSINHPSKFIFLYPWVRFAKVLLISVFGYLAVMLIITFCNFSSSPFFLLHYARSLTLRWTRACTTNDNDKMAGYHAWSV